MKDFSFNVNDNELVKKYLEGDDESFEILVKKYFRLVYSVIYGQINDSIAAEDLTQEVFIKLWKSIRKFNIDKNFKIWLLKIAKNTTIDYLRKNKYKGIPLSFFENKVGFNPILETLLDQQPQPDEILSKKEYSEKIRYLIGKLPFVYQQIIYLHYYNHLTLKEIAEMLDRPLNTVKSWHHRAILKLKDLIKDSSLF